MSCIVQSYKCLINQVYHQARPASNQGRLESCHYTQNVVDRQNPVHLASIPHHRIDPCFNHPNWLSQFLLFLLQILNQGPATAPQRHESQLFFGTMFPLFFLVEIHLSYSQQRGKSTTDKQSLKQSAGRCESPSQKWPNHLR